ncbi:MAG: toxin glutamine deamidase domain-containing protein, partial [Oscillospiraceae bacterium]
ISYLGYDPGKVAADTLKAGSILKRLDKIGGTPAGSASNVYAGISENTLTNNNKSDNIIVGTTDNFNRKTSLYTSSEDLKATNPNYSTGEYKWTNNCQRCAPTYEMRRRGFNVTALPLPCSNVEDDPIARNCFSVWNNISIRSFSTKDDVINAMSKWGDGARAQIRVTFQNNKGHTFIAEQRGTNTVFIDPQTGSEDCESIFESAIPNGIFARIDNASVNQDIIGLCCK